MGTETAGTEVNFCLFFCSHDFPFLSLFSDSPSIPYKEYSKWRILGTRGEMQAVLRISIKSWWTYWQYSSFIYSTSQVQWGKQGAMNKAMCSSHPETQVLTGWNWFLSYSSPSSQHWSEPSTQAPYSKGRAELPELPGDGRGEGGNTGSKPSKQLLEMCTEMKTPENQPNGSKRRLPNQFWEKRRRCPSQRGFFKVLTGALL